MVTGRVVIEPRSVVSYPINIRVLSSKGVFFFFFWKKRGRENGVRFILIFYFFTGIVRINCANVNLNTMVSAETRR